MDNQDKEVKSNESLNFQPFKMQGDTLNIGPGTLPDGVQISKNYYGFCLVSKKHFKKGEPVFKCDIMRAPVNTDKYKFTLNGVQYLCNSTNSAAYQDFRQIYRFMSFLNHSCQQNNYTVKINDEYVNIATKDIYPGQQLTTNYFHFDYYGSLTFKCLCDTPSCVGEVKGFKNLDLENKIKLLPKAFWARYIWENQDKSIMIVDDLKIPQMFTSKIEENKLKIYSNTQFKKGEELFKLKKQNNYMENKTIIYLAEKTYHQWNSPKQFLYFVSFLISKPDPNCKLLFEQNEIIGICQKDIKKNDQICI